MAKVSYLYEVLIRGTPDGKISGAHMVYMDQYTMDDGAVINQPRGAEPLDVAAVGGLLGKEFASAGAQVMSLTAERDAAVADAKTKTDILSDAAAAIKLASDAIAKLNP